MVRKRTLHYFCLDCEIELSSAEELARPAHFLDAVEQQGEILIPIQKVEMLVVHHQHRSRVVMIEEIAVALCQTQQITFADAEFIRLGTAAHGCPPGFR